LRVATPEGYEPDKQIVEKALSENTKIKIMHDPVEAVKGADVIYTDVWASMGQESEKKERLRVFKPYQVNSELLSNADEDAIVLHCLPAHRGEEITDEVMDGKQSAVFDQAENRLHAQKALLIWLLGVEI
jgi:ornithine carbamoyltransferase